MRFLIRAARVKSAARRAWHQHIGDLYGDLSGQRALAADRSLARYAGGRSVHLPDLILALQTYFVLCADLLAAGRLNHAQRSWSAEPFARFLRDLASGTAFAARGIVVPARGLPFGWYLGHARAEDLEAIAALWEAACGAVQPPLPPGCDAMQPLYEALMPRNLVHATGEFYTPTWLADLLLKDSGWKPGMSLIDPFAGSGVFLLAALRRTRTEDHRRVIRQFAGIDRNPVACVAAVTNLILHLADTIADRGVELPIVCADALLDEPASLPGVADILVTNPPWVGWEYVPRGYRSRLDEAWRRHGLFTAKGRDAAFLKEDLSTLALTVAWDRFLKPGGRSAVVLRPAAMQSHLAARGLRRLSLFPDTGPLELRKIRLFPGLRVFPSARAPAAAWCLRKGRATSFPVRVVEWRAGEDSTLRRPGPDVPVAERLLAATPSDPADPTSSWTIGDRDGLAAVATVTGSNGYRVRTGVFTGGANAVYYLQRLERGDRHISRYRNVSEAARRSAPAVECLLEDALVFDVVRGRDLGLWQATPGAAMLCPHTAATRMQAIPPEALAAEYPHAFRYVTSMRSVLDARQGFSGWEDAPRRLAFYALQRIGAYTFQPYKVAWRYIATDFLVAVIGPASDGRPCFANDKVMFVGCGSPEEAYFLCGLLTSEPVRWCVTATMTGTQISASAIKHLKLPAFDARNSRHAEIARRCETGHRRVAAGELASAQQELDGINRTVAALYGLSRRQMRAVSGPGRFVPA